MRHKTQADYTDRRGGRHYRSRRIIGPSWVRDCKDRRSPRYDLGMPEVDIRGSDSIPNKGLVTTLIPGFDNWIRNRRLENIRNRRQ